MKKLLLMLLCSTTLFCTACSRETISHDAFFDTFLLTDMKVDGVSTPALFNPAKGTTTPLCTDPLCAHTKKAGCPFAGFQTLGEKQYYNGAIWYLSAEGGRLLDSSVMRYDMASGKVTEFITLEEIREYIPEDVSQENGQAFGFHNDYFRYIIRSADMTPAFQFRVSLDSGKPEVVDNDIHMPYAQYKEYSLSNTPEADYTGVSYGVILTDKKGNTETILADKRISITFEDLLSEGKLIYATAYQNENGTYDWDHMTLWMYDLESGEDRVIVENFPSVSIAVAGNYMYYVLDAEDPPYIGYDLNQNMEKYNLSGGILWRTELLTGQQEIAFEMPEYTLIGTKINRVGQYVIVEYSNIDYETYTEDISDRGVWYDYAKETGRIVYDTESGTTSVYPIENT